MGIHAVEQTWTIGVCVCLRYKMGTDVQGVELLREAPSRVYSYRRHVRGVGICLYLHNSMHNLHKHSRTINFPFWSGTSGQEVVVLRAGQEGRALLTHRLPKISDPPWIITILTSNMAKNITKKIKSRWKAAPVRSSRTLHFSRLTPALLLE